jgi:glyoxylase-like metal-dependent hydrolase (beta-lactamase superfamily II)
MIDSIVVGAIATNCWIVPLNERECAVVDPGGDAEAIIARLRASRLRPSLILLTHGHFDHLAALPALEAAFGKDAANAPLICVHEADAAYLGPGALRPHRRDFALAGAQDYVDGLWPVPPAEMPAPGRFLAEGDRIGPFAVLHTPGHTPGSICFYDELEGSLFSGDTLFAGGVGRTDLPGGDGEALAASLGRLLALPPSVRVFPGHGSRTAIGRERW